MSLDRDLIRRSAEIQVPRNTYTWISPEQVLSLLDQLEAAELPRTGELAAHRWEAMQFYIAKQEEEISTGEQHIKKLETALRGIRTCPRICRHCMERADGALAPRLKPERAHISVILEDLDKATESLHQSQKVEQMRKDALYALETADQQAKHIEELEICVAQQEAAMQLMGGEPLGQITYRQKTRIKALEAALRKEHGDHGAVRDTHNLWQCDICVLLDTEAKS